MGFGVKNGLTGVAGGGVLGEDGLPVGAAQLDGLVVQRGRLDAHRPG
jgi:hypothetical protein